MTDFEVDVCLHAVLVRFMEDEDLVKVVITKVHQNVHQNVHQTFKGLRKKMELQILFAARTFWWFC